MRVPEPSPRHAGAKRNLGSGAAPPVLSESKVSGQVQMGGTVLRPRPASPPL